MKWVNRMAVVVRRKEPYFAWARSLEADPPIDYLKGRANVYLVDQEEGADRDRVLGRCWQEIFVEQLNGWWRAEKDWPKRRTLAMFHEWFEAQVMESVIDLSIEWLDAD
jgi:hypothetical protein